MKAIGYISVMTGSGLHEVRNRHLPNKTLHTFRYTTVLSKRCVGGDGGGRGDVDLGDGKDATQMKRRALNNKRGEGEGNGSK